MLFTLSGDKTGSNLLPVSEFSRNLDHALFQHVDIHIGPHWWDHTQHDNKQGNQRMNEYHR